MARSHGRIKCEIWGDEDFRALSRAAQGSYFMLLSQPLITNCGVLPFTPKRWAAYASDTPLEVFELLLSELHDARFVLIDVETDELLIRTYVEHDGIIGAPNLEKAAKKEFQTITSRRIQGVLAERFPELFGEPFRELFGEPFVSGEIEPFPEPFPSARARARPAPPLSPPLLENVLPEASSVGEEDVLSSRDSPPQDPREAGSGSLALAGSRSPSPRVTGWTWKRGSHGELWVRDPEGTDKPPSSVVQEWEDEQTRMNGAGEEQAGDLPPDPEGQARVRAIMEAAAVKSPRATEEDATLDPDDPEQQRRRAASKAALERIRQEEEDDDSW